MVGVGDARARGYVASPLTPYLRSCVDTGDGKHTTSDT